MSDRDKKQRDLVKLHQEYLALRKKFEDETDQDKKTNLYQQVKAKLREIQRKSR